MELRFGILLGLFLPYLLIELALRTSSTMHGSSYWYGVLRALAILMPCLGDWIGGNVVVLI